MKNKTKLLLFSTLLISTIIVISSNNWLSMWMGLEINLLYFVPLMFNKKKKSSSMMIYFMIQGMDSINLLISILWSSFMMISNYLSSNFTNHIMVTSLL